MGNNQQLMEISLTANNLLLQYITIHNNVFKASLRRIIPLPFIFKAVDFEAHYRETENILSQLEETNVLIRRIFSEFSAAQKEYLELLSEYVSALIETLKRLRIILGMLHAKSERLESYDWQQYKENLAHYEDARKAYASLGRSLNELYQRIT